MIYDMNTGNLKTANIYLPAVAGGSGVIGRVDLSSGNERMYYVKDHLGSTRVTISTVETGNNVAYASDYYPFGESIREFQVGTKGGKYKFTEKERDAESSYDYFGARYYNNKLGVWLSVDPLAEKYAGWNPFVYTRNNPLVLVDPNGMDDDWYQNKNGDHKWMNSSEKSIQENGETWENTGTTYSHKQGDQTYTFTQNQLTSLTVDVSSKVNWVSQFSLSNPQSACFRAVKAMLAELSLTPASGLSVGDIQVGSNGKNVSKAAGAIEGSLLEGHPIAVGLSDGRKSPNSDGVTNHFVLATGVTYNYVANTTSYTYFDPGRKRIENGTSPSNILNVTNNGIYATDKSRPTHLSTVRKNN